MPISRAIEQVIKKIRLALVINFIFWRVYNRFRTRIECNQLIQYLPFFTQIFHVRIQEIKCVCLVYFITLKMFSNITFCQNPPFVCKEIEE